MSITLTKVYGVYDSFQRGRMKKSLCTIAFDSSYSYGGEDIDTEAKRVLGFSDVRMILAEHNRGMSFEYDDTNGKIKAFSPAPPIIYEEKHTAVANTVTLDYPAAWIMNVCTTGQNMKWGKSRTAATLAANTFCIVGTIADGVRTQLYTAGANDTVYVTYVTQAWQELYKCLVQEEAVTLATGATNLANILTAFGFVEAATSGILTPTDIADTTAAGEVGVKFGFDVGATDINAAQNGQAAVVTYLKRPALTSFLYKRWIQDEDPTKAGTDPYTQTFNKPLLVWGITGAATVNGGTTQVLVESEITPAAGEANINWGYRGSDTSGAGQSAGFTIGCKSNVIVTAGSYIYGHPWEIPTVQLEVKNGADLSSLTTVRAWVIGD